MQAQGMIRWSIILGALVLVPVLFLIATPNAFGCDASSLANSVPCVVLAQITATATVPATVTPTGTLAANANVTTTATVSATMTVSATATITATSTPQPTWTPRPTPVGDNPNTARIPMWVKPEYCIEAMCPGATSAPLLNSPGGWDWIAGNSSVWYKMDDGHSLQVQIWVFANGQTGLLLDVYAPEQKDLYGSKPIGRGSLNKNYPGADLFYSGRSSAYGIWYAKLTNTTNAPVSYSFRYTRTTPSLGNSCDNCHKLIGYDWGACSDPGFCDQLHQYYDTNPSCYDHNIEADLAGNCH